MRIGRLIAVVGVVGILVWRGGTVSGQQPALPAGLAILQPQASTLAEPDLVVLPADGTARIRVTVDARDEPQVMANLKLPLSWVGSNALAFALASGQATFAEPVYVQRVDSPRRLKIADGVIAAQIAPDSERLALMTEPGGVVALDVVGFHPRSTRRLALPWSAAMIPVQYGYPSVAWSPDGARVAAAWPSKAGIEVAVCAVQAARCALAAHRRDIGVAAGPLTSLVLAWTSGHSLVLAVTNLFSRTASTIVRLDPNRLSAPGRPALAAEFGLAGAQIVGMTPDLAGRHMALLEETGFRGGATLQTARLSSGRLIGPSQIIHGGNALMYNTVSHQPFTVAPPAQAWSGASLLYSQVDTNGRGTVTRAAAWRLDTATGRRALVVRDVEWAAKQPAGRPAVALARSAGSCPVAPLAATPPLPKTLTTQSVRQTVDFYRAVRQQAYRLADGACLPTAATGPALAAIRHSLAQLRAGEWANVPGDLAPIFVQAASDRASEIANASQGERIYRGGRLVSSLPTKRLRLTYHLGLQPLGTRDGVHVSQWIVVSVSQQGSSSVLAASQSVDAPQFDHAARGEYPDSECPMVGDGERLWRTQLQFRQECNPTRSRLSAPS
ncbi:MAG TPA: hypothetical protein VKX16_11995 [Chloroflexota bacterium]|nr:hypothetical protein [Chloroflexota bacterium]